MTYVIEPPRQRISHALVGGRRGPGAANEDSDDAVQLDIARGTGERTAAGEGPKSNSHCASCSGKPPSATLLSRRWK